MKVRYPAVCILASWLLLSGCAQHQDNLPQLEKQVGVLNQKLQRLTDVAIALEHQTQLNNQSTSGAYLLPTAENPVRLNSQIGMIDIALSQLTATGEGVQGVLQISNVSAQPLPSFSATVEWGSLDSVTGKPLQTNIQSQTITVAASTITHGKQEIPLHFSHSTLESLGFIHLHHITPETQSTPLAPKA
jgi:hypothetical protein